MTRKQGPHPNRDDATNKALLNKVRKLSSDSSVPPLRIEFDKKRYTITGVPTNGYLIAISDLIEQYGEDSIEADKAPAVLSAFLKYQIPRELRDVLACESSEIGGRVMEAWGNHVAKVSEANVGE